MKRARERCLCVRIGPREEELYRRVNLLLGGGAHSFSETFREAAVVLFAFLLDERPPPVTYQRERRRRTQIQERLLRRAEALGSGVASPAVEAPHPART
jgi:hypothetical protein